MSVCVHLGAQVCGAGFETEGSFGVTTFFYEGFDILTLVLFAYTQCSHVREALICCTGILWASQF